MQDRQAGVQARLHESHAADSVLRVVEPRALRVVTYRSAYRLRSHH
jgi:hypothetical protein